MNPKALRQEKAELKSKAEALINAAMQSGKDLSGEDLKNYNNIVAKMKNIDVQLQRYDELSGVSEPGRPAVTPAVHGNVNLTRNNGGSAALREILARATSEEREQVQNLIGYLSGQISAVADLKPSGDGGALIPIFVVPALERNYAAFAPVVSVARIWGTETGADTTFPVLSDSEEAEQVDAAALTGADHVVSGDTPPTDLTGPKLGAYKLSSKPVFVPRETFTDSPINIMDEVVGALLARIMRLENLRYTKGTGVGQAEGFLTNCAHHAAGAVALDLDIALDLAYAVPALYRPNGVYMMTDITAKYLRKLKTGLAGDKRQLWADADATKGTPASLHGYPVVINNDMDDVAADGTFAGKSPLAFGDYSKFVVRKAENNQPYAYRYSVPARDGSAVILFRRSDSKLIVPEAICKLTVA